MLLEEKEIYYSKKTHTNKNVKEIEITTHDLCLWVSSNKLNYY